MSKPRAVISALLGIGLMIGLGISFYLIYAPPKEATPASAYEQRGRNTAGDDSSNNEKISTTLSYHDEAGFTFRHPPEIQIVDVTPADSLYYTSLMFRKNNERLTVEMKDTKYANLDVWYETEGQARSLVGSVALDGIKANQYADNTHLLTVAISEGVLYMIRSPRDSGFWDETHDLFVTSLVFDDPNGTSTGTIASTDKIIYEEEEIIE